MPQLKSAPSVTASAMTGFGEEDLADLDYTLEDYSIVELWFHLLVCATAYPFSSHNYAVTRNTPPDFHRIPGSCPGSRASEPGTTRPQENLRTPKRVPMMRPRRRPRAAHPQIAFCTWRSGVWRATTQHFISSYEELKYIQKENEIYCYIEPPVNTTERLQLQLS